MENAERTPFGLRLYQSRIDSGLSQEEARTAVGMKAQSTISEAEISGKRSGFTYQLALLYKVNPIWLSTGKGKKELTASNVAPFQPEEKDPMLADLAALEPEIADVWKNRLDEAEATLKRIKSEIRAAAKARRKQLERSMEPDNKPDHAPPLERRRTA